MHLRANHAPRHTSNRACTLPKPRPHTEWVPQYNNHPTNGIINPGHALSTDGLGDEPPAVAAPGTISALRRNSKSETLERQNSEFGTLPQTPKCSQTQPIPRYESPLLIRLQPQRLELFSQHGRRAIKHARHRLPGALRLLRPFPGHVDDKLVTTERQSRQDSAALHPRRLHSGEGFARTTLAPE